MKWGGRVGAVLGAKAAGVADGTIETPLGGRQTVERPR